MKFIFIFLLFSAQAFATGEYDGNCDDRYTASTCTVVNETGETVYHIHWNLEGDWGDYGGQARVNLKDGKKTKVGNGGAVACFFTKYTAVIVRTESGLREYFDDDSIRFDRDDNCTITLQ